MKKITFLLLTAIACLTTIFADAQTIVSHQDTLKPGKYRCPCFQSAITASKPTVNKFAGNFTNSFTTQSTDLCATYKVTDNSNYGTNDQGITESNFSGKIVTIRDGVNNTVLATQTVSISQKTVNFSLSLLTAYVFVEQALILTTGGTNSTQSGEVLPCLLP